MAEKKLTGTVSFIHYDKQYATIDYVQQEKKKTINGSISEKDQLRWKAANIIKKPHHFNIGDEVSFIVTLSPRGDKMIADNIQYLYNNALDNLINKSTIENRFVGYLKKVEDDYFVKETGSYLLFPLIISPWEVPPAENKLNEPVFFQLENTDKPEKVTASLFKSQFIPDYITAMQYFKKKAVINAVINNISPHGIYVNVAGNKIQAKIPLPKTDKVPATELKKGDIVPIRITHLSSMKIVVERV